ncbi:MAG: 16S rRNA (uracil(1498)-N(3))-methyltransferase [Desulfocapsaceae bacterium]|nr:16S rRNA (uracil(1498)-N(3))-methyltransferase [Desulfocapsaceae bacterium]
MNIILVRKEELNEGRVILTDHRAGHIVTVLRSAIGDFVRIGVVNGLRGTGRVCSLSCGSPYSVELAVELDGLAASVPPIDLLLALPRPIMLKRILSQAAALGFGSITLINANRVEKSFWEAGLLQEASYTPHLLHGLEQAVDTRLPEVRTYSRFKPFIEDVLPALMQDYSHCLVAHPAGDRTLKEVLIGKPGRILLAVGPEGGWVDYEVQRFLGLGFSAFTMGERILKVDTAVISLHGRVSALLDQA